VAYAPHGAGTISGLAGLLLSPNKVAGVAMLAAGQAADLTKTYWDRRKDRKKDKDAD
jgi:hypothetical protein